MILISACLLGNNCRYDGGNCENHKVLEYVKGKKIIPICPEQLGGLSTPRKPCEVLNGTGEDVLEKKAKVIDSFGVDCTMEFLKGAFETLKIAKLFDCTEIILKSNSPSCGNNFIYDGTFKGILKEGSGVTATLLMREGFKIINEKDI